jgi:motility quorum-sensing regulator/GCU-specific mRNA interferase toxin
VEKRVPHYNLVNVQSFVADKTSRPFTRTALQGGLSMGFTELQMRGIVLSLTRTDFYKSMTTHADHQQWQDVYHGKTSDDRIVYIKITGFLDGRPPVIQFKSK